MGSEAHIERDLTENAGLIPRFMTDFFHSLEERKNSGILNGYDVEASFLEVYGEDIHDLLVSSRPSLPIREDANGGIVCVGLTQRKVESASQALDILHEGTMNRTTAATLMNLTSSRSHAVFTITLVQLSRADDNSEVTTSSRFTFVDLAGSERLKKTGAEGERAREGIKINEGLLALGNVINALADEERQSENKKIYVPYRQSKLTRLLQDALGGNSQTLFLACVSPSDTNSSESLSTLHYANRARNIKNAPTKNIDSSRLELQRLQAFNHILQSELIRHRFGDAKSLENDMLGTPCDELMMRRDVNEYLSRLHELVSEKSEHIAQSININSVTSSALTNVTKTSNVTLTSPRPKSSTKSHKTLPSATPSRHGLELCDTDIFMEVNPDEDMAILNQLIELQQKESDFQQEQRRDSEELNKMKGELVEQENLLLKLQETLKVYHNMKTSYEKLMAEVQQLELEKQQLADQLEKAKTDPSQGCSVSIKKELEKVERTLARAREETTKQRLMCKKAEQEAQKCRMLEQKISDLKSRSATLMKKQKASSVQHREYVEAKTREITMLKKKERATEKKLSKLETEIEIHKKNLDKRQMYCQKLSSKLKQTEQHLMQLLASRKQHTTGQSRKAAVKDNNGLFAPDSEAIHSIEFLIYKAVQESVARRATKHEYEERLQDYREAMVSLADAIKELEESQASNSAYDNVQELEQTIEERELKIELLSYELETLSTRLDGNILDGHPIVNDHVKELLSNNDAPILRTLLLNITTKYSDAEMEQKKLMATIRRKESVIESFETEVEALNGRINTLTHDFLKRHSVLEGNKDVFTAVENLQDRNEKLSLEILALQKSVSNLDGENSQLRRDKRQLEDRLSALKERMAIAEVALKHSQGVTIPELFLTELQAIWGRLGVSCEEREVVRLKIENCLEEMCKIKLEEYRILLKETESSITNIEEKLRLMYASMNIVGLEEVELEDNTLDLLQRMNLLQKNLQQVEPLYQRAMTRRQNIVDQLTSLSSALGLSVSELNADARAVLEQAYASDARQNSLSDEFLSRCELQVNALKLEKVKMITRSAEMLSKLSDMVSEMALTADDILAHVRCSMTHRFSGIPDWWNDDAALKVTRAITAEGGITRPSTEFTQYISEIFCSLESVNQCRRILSTELHGLVEKSQKTLLKIVNCESDATQACSTFQDALLRLPFLSKEHIQACISEMDALAMGVEAMTQSEIEALTVVWEALNISASVRGQFWGEVDDFVNDSASQQRRPFESEAFPIDCEEWVREAIHESTAKYHILEIRLLKLEKIHDEVVRLSALQDAKSLILSLDSEIRILSAKLLEFEDHQCDKERLVTKKSTSSHLLKEERFRKQMQLKFAAKLEQLAQLLREWQGDEENLFDRNLLSNEVRLLLENSDKMEMWVEKRTEFMHLRTIQSKVLSKRRAESPPETYGDEEINGNGVNIQKRDIPISKKPKLCQAVSARKEIFNNTRVPLTSAKDETKKRQRDEKTFSSSKVSKATRLTTSARKAVKQSGTVASRPPLSPTPEPHQKIQVQSEKKKLTLPPFGHVLDQAFSPKQREKENDVPR